MKNRNLVLSASSFTPKNSTTLSDAFLFAAIDRTSEELKEEIVRFIDPDSESIFDLEGYANGADALVINGIVDTMTACECSLRDIQDYVDIPVKYFAFFQRIEKGLFGTPTGEELNEMFGEA